MKTTAAVTSIAHINHHCHHQSFVFAEHQLSTISIPPTTTNFFYYNYPITHPLNGYLPRPHSDAHQYDNFFLSDAKTARRAGTKNCTIDLTTFILPTALWNTGPLPSPTHFLHHNNLHWPVSPSQKVALVFENAAVLTMTALATFRWDVYS